MIARNTKKRLDLFKFRKFQDDLAETKLGANSLSRSNSGKGRKSVSATKTHSRDEDSAESHESSYLSDEE
jgi:hypothetical protein